MGDMLPEPKPVRARLASERSKLMAELRVQIEKARVSSKMHAEAHKNLQAALIIASEAERKAREDTDAVRKIHMEIGYIGIGT